MDGKNGITYPPIHAFILKCRNIEQQIHSHIFTITAKPAGRSKQLVFLPSFSFFSRGGVTDDRL